MADDQQYAKRLRSYTDGKDFVAMQESAPNLLAQMIEGIPAEVLRTKPAPGKWSVAEIVAHLADDELVTYWRYRQMLENSGCALPGFDQDEWARLGDYASKDSAESLQFFRLLRSSNLQLLRRLSADEWQRNGIHAERGPMSVEDLARHMAAHDVNHFEQIKKILRVD
jgi:uncharacterized damage-inducible protein DinB